MIDQQLIKLGLTCKDREEVFSYLSNLVLEAGYTDSSISVLEALNQREAESTTGMMDGFAIPHAKSASITKPAIAVLKLENGVGWNSLDGQPIRYVVALFIPEDEAGTTHLQLLSQVARLLMRQEFKQDFVAADTVEKMRDLLVSNLSTS